MAGLYKSVAVDYIAGRHEEVCAAMLAKELGAKAVRVQSLTARSSGRLLEEGRAAAAVQIQRAIRPRLAEQKAKGALAINIT